ncbi:hypothetical protein [Aliiruegeria sabulilitoris]|uniref:hypothetical protein n=1 Tax=Aliiruegeria sabulilitoris TaxID=1510458 RepID=UPI000A4B48FD|nr:hypothetical protein [Aliiruegeria sabulilitoris]
MTSQFLKSIRLTIPCLLLGLLAPVGAVEAQQGRLGVELNKFEPAESGGCRTFFLFRNQAGMTLEAFEMSLAVLDKRGVIDQLLSIDAAPLPIARTTLKLFEIPDIACDNISEILLHEMTACTPQNAEPMDCFEIMDLSSKASAGFVK